MILTLNSFSFFDTPGNTKRPKSFAIGEKGFHKAHHGNMSANMFFGIKGPKRKCCQHSVKSRGSKKNETSRIIAGVHFIEKK